MLINLIPYKWEWLLHERVFDILDTNSKIEDTGTLLLDKADGSIEFKKVRFSYIENEEVIKGISFTVNQGETVAIVGATGAGKSTIINLLSRFYEIDSGEISINNIAH